MTLTKPTLHLLFGKIEAGKSTLAAELAAANRTVLIAEDERLAALFADEMQKLKDYVHCTAKTTRRNDAAYRGIAEGRDVGGAGF